MTHTQLEMPSRYDAENMEHLNRLLDRVRRFMVGTGPHTLREIAKACGGSEASVSARLRELRNNEGLTVVRRKTATQGLYTYEISKEG